MNHSPDEELNELLNRYSDGQLPSDQVADLLDRAKRDPAVRDELALQQDIDAVLRNGFVVSGDPAQICDRLVAPSAPQAERSRSAPERSKVVPPRTTAAPKARGWWMAVAATVAAVGAWWIIGLPAITARKTQVAYLPKSLEQIYQEEVARGFEEYWVCDEAPRFAATFYLRHHQALRLAPLPVGTRMKGLSYLAGLSRETTAMLATVDQQPVLVFIDDLAHDKPEPVQASDRSNLHRHRRVLGPLVVYEVSPWKEPRVLQYLETVDPPRDYLDQLPRGGAGAANQP